MLHEIHDVLQNVWEKDDDARPLMTVNIGSVTVSCVLCDTELKNGCLELSTADYSFTVKEAESIENRMNDEEMRSLTINLPNGCIDIMFMD